MLGEALALSAALVWSTSVVLFKRSEAISPQGMNLFKNVVASLLLLATMPLLGLSFDAARSPLDWGRLVLSGVLGIAIADTLTFMALRRLGAGLLAVVDCAYAPTIVVLSVLWLGEQLSLPFFVGATAVVGGVLVATTERPDRRLPQLEPADRRAGVAFGVLGIVSMGIGVVLAKPVLERGALVEVTLVRCLSGVAAQLLWMAALPKHREALQALRPNPAWRSLLPASVLGSYVAMLCWLGGFKWALASTAAVLNQTSSVSTMVLARVWLKEPLSLRRAAGGLVAVIGAITIVATRG